MLIKRIIGTLMVRSTILLLALKMYKDPVKHQGIKIADPEKSSF